jgi:hypothetical protein
LLWRLLAAVDSRNVELRGNDCGAVVGGSGSTECAACPGGLAHRAPFYRIE